MERYKNNFGDSSYEICWGILSEGEESRQRMTRGWMGACWYLFPTEEVLFQGSPVRDKGLRIEFGGMAFRGLTWRCILGAINNERVFKI